MDNKPFYADGLRFSCTRCSCCCRHESGFVYLSENDLTLLSNEFKMSYTEFISAWCRWIPFGRDSERLALKEKSNLDCIFWNAGCTVYPVRPLQCRTFPFWDHVLSSPESWKNAGRDCKGIQNGELHPLEKIEDNLRRMDDELVVERRVTRIGGI